MMRALVPLCSLLALCLSSVPRVSAGEDATLVWRPRKLRQASPDGYLAVATLARAGQGPACAAVSCTREGLELHAIGADHWAVLASGNEIARGRLEDEPQSLFVKRTATTILFGVNGRWVHSSKAARLEDIPEVLVGRSAALETKSFRLVAREPVRFADDFPDPTPTTSIWLPVRGQWALSSVAYAGMSANPAELGAIFGRLDDVAGGMAKQRVPLPPSRLEDVALIVTGYYFWTDYYFTSGVRTQDVGAFGLVFAYLGPDDYHVFRWLSADKARNHCGRLELARVRKGRCEVLAARDARFDPADFYALSVEVHGDELGKLGAACAVDGLTVLSASDDSLVPGQIGFWAEAPGAVFFDDVVVGESRTPAHRTAHGTRTSSHVYDPTMRYWADPFLLWRSSDAQCYWHKAPFPGDVAVSAAIPTDRPLRLAVSATEESLDSGYSFEFSEAKQEAILRRAGKVVTQKRLESKGRKRAALAREGGRVLVALDGKPFMDFEDTAPLGGSIVGGSGVTLADLRVASPNVFEDYFNGCPTEWHVLRGQWEVMNRWICNPRWSFFAGRSDDDLLGIWSKRRLDGDCYADVDVGVMMLPRAGGYTNMRDIAVTLCAESEDLTSGYTVIVGADHNQVTQLYRRGKLVASTSDPRARLPAGYSAAGELRSQHRGWIHIRLAKEGRAVRFYLWDRLGLSYEDPDPLPGGHVAIWSLDNGLLLAKVRMAATRLGAPEPVLRTDPLFTDHALTSDCCDGSARITPQGSAYEITSTVSGGPFAVAFRPRVFSALERPQLSFEIKLSPEAKIDLYFTCHCTPYRVPVSGPNDPYFQGVTLPAPQGVKADGQWHRVTVSLLDVLRARHPDDKLLMVWEPLLANLSKQGYVLAGFGGNPPGATYWLRNIAWSAPETPPGPPH